MTQSSTSLTALPLMAVGMDELLIQRIQTITHGSELVVVASSTSEVLSIEPSSPARVLVGSQWSTDQDLANFCHSVRERFHSRSRIVAIAGLPGRRPNFSSGVFGVDDIIQRPFGGDLLRRLREAFTLLAEDDRSSQLRGELQRALDRRETGELVIRSGSASASIHVEDGHIVWAHVSTMPTSLADIVDHAGITVDEETTRAIIEETQRKGVHFAQVLIDWGILEPASSRDALRRFIADRVKHILSLPNAAALFLTRSKKKREMFRFRRQELFNTHEINTRALAQDPAHASNARPAPSRAELDAMLARVRATEGVMGAALVDRCTGNSVAHFGDVVDIDVLWGQYALLATIGEDAQDSIATSGGLCYLMRAVNDTPSLLLFVVATLSDTTVGLLRTSLAHIGFAPKEPPPP